MWGNPIKLRKIKSYTSVIWQHAARGTYQLSPDIFLKNKQKNNEAFTTQIRLSIERSWRNFLEGGQDNGWIRDRRESRKSIKGLDMLIVADLYNTCNLKPWAIVSPFLSNTGLFAQNCVMSVFDKNMQILCGFAVMHEPCCFTSSYPLPPLPPPPSPHPMGPTPLFFFVISLCSIFNIECKIICNKF